MTKILFRIEVFAFIAGIFVGGGCNRHEEINNDIFATPITNYSITSFATFQPFEAKMADKHLGSYRETHSGKTNLFFTIFIEKTNGDRFAVSGNPASQAMFQVVNSLEKDHDYIFPSALLIEATNLGH